MTTQLLNSLILGLLVGALLEFIYRSYEEKRLVTPRLVNIQMYGLTAVFLYGLSLAHFYWVWEVLLIALATTGIELLTGWLYLKIYKIRLWDYRAEAWNYRGLVCVRFSIYWLVLAAFYYYLISPHLFIT